MSTPFDTLTAARDMEKAGLDREAAEAIAGAIRSGQGDLATKADLDTLEQALRADMDAFRHATKGDIAALERSTKAEIADMKTGIADVKADLRWIMRIGGAIVALLALPVVRDLVATAAG